MYGFPPSARFPHSFAPNQGFTPASAEPCIGFPAGFERIGLPIASTTAPCVGYPLEFSGAGQPTAESAITALQRRGQQWVDSSVKVPSAYPLHAHAPFYGATGQVDLRQEPIGALESIKEKYLRLGQEWDVPHHPRNELSGIAEEMRTWASVSFSKMSQPGGSVPSMIPREPANTFFDAAMPAARRPLAHAQAPIQPNSQKRKRQAITSSLPEWEEIFPDGLDFSKLSPLPIEFDLARQQDAAKNIFASVHKDHKMRNDLSEAAARFLKNLHHNYSSNTSNTIKNASTTDQTLRDYLCKAYRFIRFIEMNGKEFDRDYVDFHFKVIFNRYNQICEKSCYSDKNYYLSKNFRKFFFEGKLRASERKRELLEIAENLSESDKKTILDYESFLTLRLESKTNIDRYCKAMMRFSKFLSKTKTQFLSNVNEGNANKLYGRCFEAKGFGITGKGLKKGKPENPAKEVLWLKEYLEFICHTSPQQQASPIQVSSDEAESTANPAINTALSGLDFFTESVGEFAGDAEQNSVLEPEAEAQTQTFSWKDFLNSNEDNDLPSPEVLVDHAPALSELAPLAQPVQAAASPSLPVAESETAHSKQRDEDDLFAHWFAMLPETPAQQRGFAGFDDFLA